jgi:hypothetical protein
LLFEDPAYGSPFNTSSHMMPHWPGLQVSRRPMADLEKSHFPLSPAFFILRASRTRTSPMAPSAIGPALAGTVAMRAGFGALALAALFVAIAALAAFALVARGAPQRSTAAA